MNGSKWDNPSINSYENPYSREKETNHHIMPDSRANDIIKEAQIMLFESFHQSLHKVFGNATPSEMLYKTMTINSKVLSDRFKTDLFDMLNDPNYVYQRGLFIPKDNLRIKLDKNKIRL